MLNIDHKKEGRIDQVTLEGILNADSSPQLETILETIAELEQPQVLVDLPELTYISSAGIGCFIGVIKRIRTKGGDLRFSNMRPNVKRVFILLDMADFFKFFPSLEEGLNSFEPG